MKTKKKPRGLRRKCRNMVAQITWQTQNFPSPHFDLNYWDLPLPVAQNFIDSPKTPFDVRRLCVQTLLNRARYLSNLAPQNCRVLVVVILPELWASQIVVFFDESCFHAFFERDGDSQRWTPRPHDSLIARWNLDLPANFIELAFDELQSDENGASQSQIWCFHPATAPENLPK